MSDSPIQKITDFISRITGHMQIPCEVSVSDEGNNAYAVAIHTPEHAKLLIGKDGQNLKALEHVVRAALAKHTSSLTVDVNDYRKSRANQIIELVKLAAGRVRDTRKSEALSPMTSYERRIAHTELASWNDVATESIGQEPQRRVVIKPL
jgi:spoIIIJ-associated protein